METSIIDIFPVEILGHIVDYCLFSTISCTNKLMHQLWYKQYPRDSDCNMIPRKIADNYSALDDRNTIILADIEQDHRQFAKYLMSCNQDDAVLIVKGAIEWKKWKKVIGLGRVMELGEYERANPADLGYRRYFFYDCFSREALPQIHPVHLESATVWLYKVVGKNSRPSTILKRLKAIKFREVEFKSEKFIVLKCKVVDTVLGNNLPELYNQLIKNPFLDSLEHKKILESIHTDPYFPDACSLIKFEYYPSNGSSQVMRLRQVPDIHYLMEHYERLIMETVKNPRGYIYHRCRKPGCAVECALINILTGDVTPLAFESELDIEEIYYFGDPHQREVNGFASKISTRKKPITIYFWLPSFSFWKCDYVPAYL